LPKQEIVIGSAWVQLIFTGEPIKCVWLCNDVNLTSNNFFVVYLTTLPVSNPLHATSKFNNLLVLALNLSETGSLLISQKAFLEIRNGSMRDCLSVCLSVCLLACLSTCLPSE
jgi:hypothetical protein